MAQRQARQLIVTEHGGSGVLQVQSKAFSDPGPGQLLVEVAASGINFIEVYQREGIYPVPTPFALGSEAAGTVVAVGAARPGQDANFAVGDVVAWAGLPASHAELALVDAEFVVPVPEGLSPEIAAAAMLQGMTAQYLVTSTYAVQPGDTVLVHAAAGGVGQLLVQFAHLRGARVVATVGSEAKAEVARSVGADEVIRYDEVTGADLAAAVRAANGGSGVAAAYDGVGKATFEASLGSLRPRGMLALFGAASGQVPPFDLQRLNPAGSLFVTRPTLAHYIATREELLWRSGEVLSALADGSLKLQIGGRYPLEEARSAYDALESRRTTGKLVLIP